MLPDFELITHRFDNDITIIPIADVHLGAAEHMEKEWCAFLEMVQKTPNVYITLGGDLLNNATKNSLSNVYDEVIRPSTAKRMMADMLAPIKDRIICSVTGNHERRSSRDVDQDPMYDIMCKLDLEHLWRENIAFVKIQLGRQENESGTRTGGYQRPSYNLVVTHGSGGGIYTGTAVLRGERFGYVIDNLDLLVLAHTHKPFTTQPGKIVIDPRNNKVTVKPFKVITATSWLEYGGYAMQKMLLPSTHCLHTIQLSSTHKELVVTM